MYQALYRKWRPQTFDAVVGQKHITETLKNQVRSDRLSHAYLFIGTRGTGKTTCARILAKAVNCEHPVDGNPCGVCPACRGIGEGSVMDVVELDAASNNGVDNVRALREEAVFSPSTVKKRVYIIDEVHMLSTSAFNALLKILEEPPEHLMFILATTELQKVPATILSRCQRHSFHRLDAAEISEYLEYIAQQEDFFITHEAADLIARLAEGGVRDALSLLDQCSSSEIIDADTVYSAMGLAGNRRTMQLLNHIVDGDTERVLESFNKLWMDGKDPSSLLTELESLVRDTLMVKVAPKSAVNLISGNYELSELKMLAQRLTPEEMICVGETLQRAVAAMRDSGSPRTSAELCLISLCDNTLGESLTELRARVSRLEEQMAMGLPVRSVSGDYEVERDEDAYFSPRESGHDEAEYEELDPEQFMEEQPEDSFVSKKDSFSVLPETAEAKEEDTPPSRSGEDMWDAVCTRVEALLPIDVRLQLRKPDAVRGYVDGGVLKIETASDFLYGRFNRPDVLAKLGQAASEICGRELHAVVSEMKDDARPKRSIEDLRQFKEVKFN